MTEAEIIKAAYDIGIYARRFIGRPEAGKLWLWMPVSGVISRGWVSSTEEELLDMIVTHHMDRAL